MKFDELNKIVTESIQSSSNRFELWSNLLNKLNVKTACEIGVWRGDFAKFIMDNVKSIKKYIFIDPWRNLAAWNKPANVSNQKFEEIRIEAFEKNKMHTDKIHELRMTTKESSNHIKEGSIDFAYIDGDHTLRGITIDLNVMISCIKNFGFIGGDDFTKNIWQHSNKYDPTEVFPYAIYFAEANNFTIFTLPFNQFLIFKNKNFDVVDYGGYSKLSPSEIYSRNIFKIFFKSLIKIRNNLFKIDKKQ